MGTSMRRLSVVYYKFRSKEIRSETDSSIDISQRKLMYVEFFMLNHICKSTRINKQKTTPALHILKSSNKKTLL